MRKKANKRYLLIGGAPKCGTSSLFDQLASWPAILPSQPKETFFFLDEGHPLLNRKKNIHQNPVAAFSDYFPAGQGLHLEATTHLLYQSTMLKQVEQLGDVRLLFVLREPARRLWSSFRYTQNNLANFKRELSFSAFAELLMKGRAEELSDYLHPNSSQYVLERDLEYGCYAKFLKPWLHHYGQQDCELVFFEELVSKPEQVLTKLAEWLGLSEAEVNVAALARKNSTLNIRQKGLHRWTKKIASRLPASQLKNWVKAQYISWQTTKATEETAEDQSALLALREWYRPHNEQLAQLLNRDQLPW